MRKEISTEKQCQEQIIHAPQHPPGVRGRILIRATQREECSHYGAL